MNNQLTEQSIYFIEGFFLPLLRKFQKLACLLKHELSFLSIAMILIKSTPIYDHTCQRMMDSGWLLNRHLQFLNYANNFKMW